MDDVRMRENHSANFFFFGGSMVEHSTTIAI
jgi:hypothetical protein